MEDRRESSLSTLLYPPLLVGLVFVGWHESVLDPWTTAVACVHGVGKPNPCHPATLASIAPISRDTGRISDCVRIVKERQAQGSIVKYGSARRVSKQESGRIRRSTVGM